MDQATPIHTPIDKYESIQPGRPEEERANQLQYQKRIESLMFLMTGTRIDLAFVIGKLSQFCCDPTVRHMNAVNRVLKNIRGTTSLGLRYQGTGTPKGFADSAYGDDQEDRKSTYGFALLCGQAACVWYSRKQRGVATSTTEAEYVALAEGGKTIVWTTRWLQGVRFRALNEGPMTLLGDNKGAIGLTRNPEHHQRTKHIDVQYHYIRQLVEDEAVTIDYIPTAQMAADILTKPLNKKLFEQCRELLGMYSHELSDASKLWRFHIATIPILPHLRLAVMPYRSRHSRTIIVKVSPNRAYVSYRGSLSVPLPVSQYSQHL